jgi:colanic acid/amylovoran biosynthesis glycosyltransferase
LSVGRLVEKKGLRYAIEALSMPGETLARPFIYRIVGEGPLRQELGALAAERGIGERVIFCGALPAPRVQELMSGAHALLAPSVTATDGDMEGIPVVLMEAMALGPTVFSTRHSGIPELVRDGDTGYCLAEHDSLGLSRALVSWSKRPSSWSAMTERARRLVELEFNAELLARRLADALSALGEAPA